MEKTQNKKIAIISNDAGGAEILCKWVNINYKNHFFFSLSGPAKRIFKINKIKFLNLGVKKAVSKSSIVFTGTSLKSNHELKAIKFARKKNKKSFSFLDHWINYENRFIRDKKKIFPDTVCTLDKYAYKKAKKIFGNKVKLLNNFYFEVISKFSFQHIMSSN